MNNNNDKMKHMNIDDMKIKSHLNDALDLSGISVSEDLINRTLEAIKKQPVEKTNIDNSVNIVDADNKVDSEVRQETRKAIPWNRYIRTVAGVAAAVIVVVVGYRLADQGLLTKNSKNSVNNEMAADQSSDNATKEETSVGATYSTTMDTDMAADANSDAQNSVDGATAGTDTEAAPRFSIAADSSQPEEQPLLKAAGAPEEVTLTFRDIFFSDPAQANSITITDETNGNVITLSTQEQISDFYTVMDNHQFTYSSETQTVTNYTVEISSAESNKVVYDMIVGDNVIVNCYEGETSSQSVYIAQDQTLLLQNLQELYQRYSN